MVQKDTFPLPLIGQTLQRVKGAKWVSALDLKDAFWHVVIPPESRQYFAFNTTQGLFQFTVMPFGYTNAPAVFQRVMNVILESCQSFASAYLVDIMIYSKTEEEHKGHVEEVLSTLHDFALTLNIKKCKFFRHEVAFFGYIINKDGIRTDPVKLEKVNNWPLPRSLKEVRSFVQFCSFYRDFVSNFAKIAAPLMSMYGGGNTSTQPIVLSPEKVEAFEALRDLMLSPHVLANPRYGPDAAPFVIDTDASQQAIGGILQQADEEGKLKPLAFMSKKFNNTQQRYLAQEREMLALVYALDHWKHFIEGCHIEIRTDHKSLSQIMDKKDVTRRMSKFITEVSNFSLTIN